MSLSKVWMVAGVAYPEAQADTSNDYERSESKRPV
jgi:hypothetical protein